MAGFTEVIFRVKVKWRITPMNIQRFTYHNAVLPSLQVDTDDCYGATHVTCTRFAAFVPLHLGHIYNSDY